MGKSGADKSGRHISRQAAALIFLACCVLFSLLIVGGAKLSGRRAAVMRAFDGGQESIMADLALHNENAYNILTVARRVLGENDADVMKLDKAYRQMNGAASPAAVCAADKELDAAVITLVGRLYDAGMNEKDKRLVDSEKASMDSQDMIISRSEYNAEVAEYAEVVSSFPANLIALARGLGAPEYYK